MRLLCLFLVGISAFACKDKPAAKPADPGAARPPTPAGSAAVPAAPAASAPAAPALDADKSFDDEQRDAAWAGSMEQQVHAVAPQLSEVACKRMQCRVTLTAQSEAELVAATDKLQASDSLPSIDGMQHILLTKPEQSGGTYKMKLYVRFDRE